MDDEQIIEGLQYIRRDLEITLSVFLSSRGRGRITENIERQISTLDAAIEKIKACESPESLT